MTQKQLFFARGKLLLSSEYFVLDGALALALPTRLGQHIQIDTIDFNGAGVLQWVALDAKGAVWFEAHFSPHKFHIIETSDKSTAVSLQTILRSISTDFIVPDKVTKVQTELDFPIEWGLGSSSTLIYLLAQWSKMDAFDLLRQTFGGSGYDVACAGEEQPILYHLDTQKTPHWETTPFDPPFKKQLYFVYLGKKQDSRKGIRYFKEKVNKPQKYTPLFTALTHEMLQASDLITFEKILTEHENLVAKILRLPRSQHLYFDDYAYGITKSLGAWGGDFVLATSEASAEETRQYFNSKGFDVVLPYSKLIV